MAFSSSQRPLVFVGMLLLIALICSFSSAMVFNTPIQVLKGSTNPTFTLYGNTPEFTRDVELEYLTVDYTSPSKLKFARATVEVYASGSQVLFMDNTVVNGSTNENSTQIAAYPAAGAKVLQGDNLFFNILIELAPGAKAESTPHEVVLSFKYVGGDDSYWVMNVPVYWLYTEAPLSLFAPETRFVDAGLVKSTSTQQMSHRVFIRALNNPRNIPIHNIRVSLTGPWYYKKVAGSTMKCTANGKTFTDVAIVVDGKSTGEVAVLSINTIVPRGEIDFQVIHGMSLMVECEGVEFLPRVTTTTQGFRNAYQGSVVVDVYDNERVLMDSLPSQIDASVSTMDSTRFPIAETSTAQHSVNMARTTGEYVLHRTFNLTYGLAGSGDVTVGSGDKFHIMTNNLVHSLSYSDFAAVSLPKLKMDSTYKSTLYTNHMVYKKSTTTYPRNDLFTIDMREALTGGITSAVNQPKGHTAMVLQFFGQYKPTANIAAQVQNAEALPIVSSSLWYETQCTELKSGAVGNCVYWVNIKKDQVWTRYYDQNILPRGTLSYPSSSASFDGTYFDIRFKTDNLFPGILDADKVSHLFRIRSTTGSTTFFGTTFDHHCTASSFGNSLFATSVQFNDNVSSFRFNELLVEFPGSSFTPFEKDTYVTIRCYPYVSAQWSAMYATTNHTITEFEFTLDHIQMLDKNAEYLTESTQVDPVTGETKKIFVPTLNMAEMFGMTPEEVHAAGLTANIKYTFRSITGTLDLKQWVPIDVDDAINWLKRVLIIFLVVCALSIIACVAVCCFGAAACASCCCACCMTQPSVAPPPSGQYQQFHDQRTVNYAQPTHGNMAPGYVPPGAPPQAPRQY